MKKSFGYVSVLFVGGRSPQNGVQKSQKVGKIIINPPHRLAGQRFKEFKFKFKRG